MARRMGHDRTTGPKWLMAVFSVANDGLSGERRPGLIGFSTLAVAP